MSFPDKINFEVAFTDVPDPIGDVWHSLESFLASKKLMPKMLEISRTVGAKDARAGMQNVKLRPGQIGSFIIDHELDRFLIYMGNGHKRISYLLHYYKDVGRQTTLRPNIEHMAESPSDWKELIEGLMILFPCFGAWQWQTRYEAWQSGSRIGCSQESLFGEIPPGTKRWVEKSIDGIGPDAEFIDVSQNPGRVRELVPWIYFHPTAEMWLGPHFWQYAKCKKEEALAADFFIEKRDTPHYLYLKCWPEPFTRPDGEQGRMQQRLWKLFFQEDCEWPPGSGTICDDPMYGPPELMPGYVPPAT